MAMDYVPRWLAKLMSMGAIRMPVQGMHPSLLYADDALFFVKPEEQQIQVLKIVMLTFGIISGLKVNLEKSEMVATATPRDKITELAAILGCKEENFPFKYLGLPLSDSKLNRAAYMPLIANINKKLTGWAGKLLTQAGRIVLINSVLSSIPIYFMTVFNLPVWVIKEIDKTRRNFLWRGARQDEKKIHLANWELVCKPKNMGGLGIKNLTSFNKALLAKWYWQWQVKEEKLWKKMFKAIYGAGQGIYTSYFYNANLKAVQDFYECFTVRIAGRGDTIRLWNQDWGIGVMKYRFQTLYTFTITDNTTLQEFILQSDLDSLFGPVLSEQATEQLQELKAEKIRLMPALYQNETGIDDARWRLHSTGIFTVKRAYYTMENSPMIASDVHKIWKLRVPPRIRVFGWLILHNKLLTAQNLRARGFHIVGICYMCRQQDETTRHLFNECAATEQIYRGVMQQEQAIVPVRDRMEVLTQTGVNQKTKELILLTHFIVWRERCNRIFKEKTKQNDVLIQEVRTQWSASAVRNFT